jgi:uncharacterized protein (DUF2384 family)
MVMMSHMLKWFVTEKMDQITEPCENGATELEEMSLNMISALDMIVLWVLSNLQKRLQARKGIKPMATWRRRKKKKKTRPLPRQL